MEWRSTISASWLQVQLLVTNVPRNLLVSANGNSYCISCSAAGDAGSYYTYAGFLVMGNGDGEDGDAILLPRTRDRPPGTTVVGLLASAMENGEGSLAPASSSPCRGTCLFAN